MRIIRWIIAAILVLLPVGIATPAQAADTLRSFVCTSSIDWRCQPANLPILIELGVVEAGAAGGGAAGGTAVVGASAGGATGGLSVGGSAAGLGILSVAYCWIISIITPTNCDAAAKGIMGMNGVKDLTLKTDPTWTPPAGFTCDWPGGPRTSGTGSLSAALTHSCVSNPLVANSSSNWASASVVGDFVFRAVPSGTGSRGLTMTIDPTGTPAGAWQLKVIVRCQNTTTPGLSTTTPVQTINSVTTGGDASTTVVVATTTLCGSGYLPRAVEMQVGPSTSITYGTIWNYLDPEPVPASTDIRGESQTTIICKNPATGETLPVTTSTGQQVVPPGSDIRVADAACPLGWINISTKIDFDPFGTAPPVEVVPPTAPDPGIESLPDDYPDCFPAPSSGACALTLWQVQPSGGLLSCGEIGQLCIGWAQSPSAPSQYKCYYGPYEIDLNKCSAYRAPEHGVLPNTKPDGSTIPYNEPVPSSWGNPTLDPITGLPVPVPTPSTPLDPERAECFPTGWGALNPVSWVIQPMMCALERAFVPRPSAIQSMVDGVAGAWESTMFAQLEPIVAPFLTLPVFDGCDGLPIDMDFDWPIVWGIHWRFGEACEGPLNTTAQIVRAITGVGIVLLGIRTLTSMFGGVIQFRGFGKSGE